MKAAFSLLLVCTMLVLIIVQLRLGSSFRRTSGQKIPILTAKENA